jgi:nitrate/nitrite transporter NarK
MLVRVLRILLGFAVGCFASGLTLVLFVFPPSELAGLPSDVRADRLGSAIELATYLAAQVALFSAPFAFVSLAIGEMLGRRRWTYYAMTGLLIAGLGFFVQRPTGEIGQPTIGNNYALTAFLASGFAGGFLYWVVAGRFSGRRVQITRPLEPAARQSAASPGAA